MFRRTAFIQGELLKRRPLVAFKIYFLLGENGFQIIVIIPF